MSLLSTQILIFAAILWIADAIIKALRDVAIAINTKESVRDTHVNHIEVSMKEEELKRTRVIDAEST